MERPRSSRPTSASGRCGFETANRRVAFTQLKDVSVSTVFLGTDQALLPGDLPLLFETKVFGGPADAELRRYSTWDEAEQGHGAVVSRSRLCWGRWSPERRPIRCRKVRERARLYATNAPILRKRA